MLGANLLSLSLLLGSGLIATAAGASLALPYSKRLRNKLFPLPQESLLSDLLPFLYLMEDGQTVVCKDGRWSSVLVLEGLYEGGQTHDERLAQLTKRRQWLDEWAKEEVSFSLMTHRMPVQGQGYAKDFDYPVLQQIDEHHQKGFEKTYRNVHYLLLSQKPKVNNSKKKSSFSKDNQEKKNIEAYQRWKELTQSVFDHLRHYQPRVLRQTEKDSSLLSFWSRLINGFEDHPVLGLGNPFLPLSRRLVSSTLHFHPQEGMMEWDDGSKKLYSVVLCLREWGDVLSQNLMTQILSLPSEMRLVHHLSGYNILRSTKELEQSKRQALLFTPFNQHIQRQFYQALEWTQSDQGTLYDAQSCLFLSADNKDDLFDTVDKVRGLLRLAGTKPNREIFAAETLWLSQFPGFNKYTISQKLFSQNVAALASFPKNHSGLSRSDWGEGPIRQFRTATGSAYDFQMHVSSADQEVGHCLLLAPSGGGKTTLFQHLIAGALRHPNLRAYIFDRFQGTQLFTEAIGGKVIDLSREGNLGLNPLQCEETSSNKAFLINFLLQLANTTDDQSTLAAGQAVDTIFKLPLESRSLSNIYREVINEGSQLKEALKKWVGEGPYARYFNSTVDSLDIHKSRLVTFEMGELQGLKQVYPAVLRYVIHRIREQVMREKLPHILFVDEASPMLEDAMFREYVKQFLREHRKLRGSVTLCFQDPSGIMKSDLKDTILSQCQTVFFYPNSNAQPEDFEPFRLTQDEWSFIKGTSSHKVQRGVLVKKTMRDQVESVILDIDLSDLGPYLNLYQSGPAAASKARSYQQAYGDQWVSAYIKDCTPCSPN